MSICPIDSDASFDQLVASAGFLHCIVTILPFVINGYLVRRTLRLCKYPVSLLLLIEASMSKSLLKQLLLWWLPNGDFLILTLLDLL